MKLVSELNLSLPIRGMSCSGCAVKVETAVQNLPGVVRADVDLTTNRVNIAYNPNKVDLVEFQHAVMDAGYSIPTSLVTLNVQGMSCMSCVARVEGALKDLPGVLDACVDLAQANVQVTFVPEISPPLELEQAVRDAGYQAALSDTISGPLTVDPENKYDANRIGRLRRDFKRI